MNTDTRTQHGAAYNEPAAKRLIDHVVAATPRGASIPERTARLIAATIHGGPGTALASFAATGVLDQPAATDELNLLDMGDLPTRWWFALDTYLRSEATEVRHE